LNLAATLRHVAGRLDPFGLVNQVTERFRDICDNDSNCSMKHQANGDRR